MDLDLDSDLVAGGPRGVRKGAPIPELPTLLLVLLVLPNCPCLFVVVTASFKPLPAMQLLLG